MAKITLSDVNNILGSPTSAQTTINNNSRLIEQAIENTLSRDGTTPNQMAADIDLNSNDLLNVGLLDADRLILDGQELGNAQAPLFILDEVLEARDDAQDFALLSQAWAEGTEPGGPGTKSAREWAEDASEITDGLPSRAYAISSFNPVTAPDFINVAGYTTAGDGGDGLYRKVAVEPTHNAKLPLTLQNSSVVWYELADKTPKVAALGAKTDGVTDDRAAVSDTISFAKYAVLPKGETAVAQTLLIDNSTMSGETESGPQGTVISGLDARLSILRAKAGLTGPVLDVLYGTGAAAHAYHRFEKISVLGNGVSSGVRFRNAAFLRLSDLSARGCNVGLDLQSVLSTSIRDGRFDANAYGVSAVKGGGFSYPNALKYDSCVFSNNTLLGYSGGGPHHNVQFLGGSVEGNGTQGNVSTGGVFLNFNGGVEGAVGAIFQGVYFEGNGGAADIRLENTGANYVTVLIEACNFNRVSAAKFVTANIVAIGKINLVLVGNAFRSMNDYVESAARPYISRSSQVRVSEVGNYFASAVAAAGFLSRGNSERARGAIAANGAPLSLPDGWSCAKTGTGLYDVTHNFGVATPSADYSVVATSIDASPSRVQRLVKDVNKFTVVTENSAGALQDVAFDFELLLG